MNSNWDKYLWPTNLTSDFEMDNDLYNWVNFPFSWDIKSVYFGRVRELLDLD